MPPAQSGTGWTGPPAGPARPARGCRQAGLSNIHFLRRAKDTEKLVARGRVVKEGRTTGLVTAEVFDDTDKLIATADMTVYYVDENTYTDPAAQK